MTRPPTIGVLSKLVGGYYFGGVLRGVAHGVADAGGRAVNIQTIDAGTTHEEVLYPPPYRGRLAWDAVDAWIVVIQAVDEDYMAVLQRCGKPVVTVSPEFPQFPFPGVAPDNRGGVRQAVEHLLGHGHRRIAFAGNLVQWDVRERFEAYVDAVRAAGLEPDPALFYETPDNLEAGGYDAGLRMLAAGLPSTAVIVGTDWNAVGLMRALTEGGKQLPADQAVIGFDNEDVAGNVSPPLTSVAQHFEDIGRRAASLALDLLAGGAPPDELVTVPTTLVRRESCGCLPAVRIVDRPTLDIVDDDSLRGVLVQRWLSTLALHTKDSASSTRLLAPLADEVVALLRHVVAGGHADAAGVRDLCAALYLLSPHEESVASVMAGVRVASRLLLRSAAPSVDVAETLDDLLHAMTLELTRVHAKRQHAGHVHFQRLLRSQYGISMDLLGRGEEDPRSLSWMRGTNMRAAVFATWNRDGDAAEPTLTVAGCFSRDGAPVEEVGTVLPLSAFPPAGCLALVDGDDVVSVMPVKVGASDWGWLAVVGPIETRVMSGRESTDQWAALLTVALDREALLRSLHEQREHLAQAYHRERDLVEGLRTSEQRYALAVRATNDGLWDWDLVAGTVFYSARWKAMLGLGEDEVGTSPDEWFSRVHPDDVTALQRAVHAHLSGETPALELEHRVRGAGDHYRWIQCNGLAVLGDDGEPARMVGSATDVTERRELEERLRRDALYDVLTGLPNRALFLDRLGQAIEHAKRHPRQLFAMLFLDLDGFKVVNDSLGHLFGDRLLVKVAERLQENLRPEDTAARFGGDEFAILLRDVRDPVDVSLMAERLQRQLRQPFAVDGHQVVVSAGIGITLSSTGYERAEDVLRDADIAMYRAKAEGGSTHAIFDVAMHVRAVNRLRTENELRRALEAGQFELHYQPIVRLADGTLHGFEALLRWRHPDNGLLLPGDFLGIAEETSLTVPIGEWVLTEACRRLAAWRADFPRHGDLGISINVSNRQFWHSELTRQLEHAIGAAGVPACGVRVEITEGVIMDSPETAELMLRRLHAMGVHLHIDDFGTGYSSLEALHRFPIDALKIDRSFIARLGDERGSKIVRTILQMGEDLEVDVIAEGVETSAQLETLRRLACTHAQGDFLSPPVPVEQATALLAGGLRSAHGGDDEHGPSDGHGRRDDRDERSRGAGRG